MYSKLQMCPLVILYSVSANSPSKQQGDLHIVIGAMGSVDRVITLGEGGGGLETGYRDHIYTYTVVYIYKYIYILSTVYICIKTYRDSRFQKMVHVILLFVQYKNLVG